MRVGLNIILIYKYTKQFVANKLPNIHLKT